MTRAAIFGGIVLVCIGGLFWAAGNLNRPTIAAPAATTSGTETLRLPAGNTQDESLARILQVKDYTSRREQLIRAFEVLIARDPELAADAMLKLDPKFREYDILWMVSEALTDLDPEKAFAFARELDGTDYRMAEHVRKAALSKLALENPAVGAELVLRRYTPETQFRGLDVIAEAWGVRDPVAAMGFADRLSDPHLRMGYLAQVFSGIASQNSTAAMSLANSATFSEAERDRIADVLIQPLIENSPQQAVQWAMDLPESFASRTNAVLTSVEAWGNRDVDGAGAFVEELPIGESRDLAVLGFVRSLNVINPTAATALTASIERESLRRQAFLAVADGYRGRDADVANAWLASLSMLPDEWQEELESRIRVR